MKCQNNNKTEIGVIGLANGLGQQGNRHRNLKKWQYLFFENKIFGKTCLL
jgi:hypothetical protein